MYARPVPSQLNHQWPAESMIIEGIFKVWQFTLYIHTYIHTHIHTYIHTYIHAYIHTYTHTVHTLHYMYIHLLNDSRQVPAVHHSTDDPCSVSHRIMALTTNQNHCRNYQESLF